MLPGLPANSNYIVSMDTFVAEVLAGADMYVVDIRQPDVYNQSHIIGAVNVPWGSDACGKQ
jgi:rhodanese-related sulfurtransferase